MWERNLNIRNIWRHPPFAIIDVNSTNNSVIHVSLTNKLLLCVLKRQTTEISDCCKLICLACPSQCLTWPRSDPHLYGITKIYLTDAQRMHFHRFWISLVLICLHCWKQGNMSEMNHVQPKKKKKKNRMKECVHFELMNQWTGRPINCNTQRKITTSALAEQLTSTAYQA